ncbi:uncharacterized protein BX664DRAFT_384143 [Halteromyces radiatus]|uniref:uncharacterized protein n=1 Tax=Halteromyces radiatus TaxID=101107 RepID=UPI00221E5177|nr:uncharacterized protein BX664DRAFT_384143 [Halteromyces radiatus]KAI8092597.1 hypothetical protein BX664DRAFT_384143 [Halteromyces radiatus]
MEALLELFCAPSIPSVNVTELKKANFAQLLEKTMISSSEIMNTGSLRKEVSNYMTNSLNNKSHSVSNTRRTVQQILDAAINTRHNEKEKNVLRWVQFCVDTCLSQQVGATTANNSDQVKPTKKKQEKKKEKEDDDDADSIGYHVIGASDDDYVPSDSIDDDDDQQVPSSPPAKKKTEKDDKKKKPTTTKKKKEEDQPPFIQPNAGAKAVVSYFSSSHPVAASEKNGLASGHFIKSYFFPSKESFNAFTSVLNSAQKTIDVCVFSLTDDDVADVLIAAKKRNVTIRIITDNQQAAGVGADAERLQKDHGIPYKTDHTTGYMHNKFAVVDSKTLINGSFNWSKGARFKNRENIIITNLPYCIQEFQAQFDALWEEF